MKTEIKYSHKVRAVRPWGKSHALPSLMAFLFLERGTGHHTYTREKTEGDPARPANLPYPIKKGGAQVKTIVNRMIYDTEKAEVVATDRYWDGHNWDRHGRTQTLMKTERGNFFMFYETRWQGERDHIEPLDPERAKNKYEELPIQEMDYKEAFGEEVESA